MTFCVNNRPLLQLKQRFFMFMYFIMDDYASSSLSLFEISTAAKAGPRTLQVYSTLVSVPKQELIPFSMGHILYLK